MADYSKAVIYIITTGDDFYVGSAHNFNKRKERHKFRIFNENNDGYNFKYCKKIRENNGDWNMEIYKHFPCENELELHIEEQRVMDELKPTLNEKNAYMSNEELKKTKKEYNKIYKEKNKQRIHIWRTTKIVCECGSKLSRDCLVAHRKTPKHIKLMAEINLNK